MTSKRRSQLSNLLNLAEKALTDSQSLRKELREIKATLVTEPPDLFSEMIQHLQSMPSKPKSPRTIYFIQNGDRVKIGIASDVQRRLSGLQGANPTKLELLGCVSEAKFPEKALHARFKKYHHSREWFILCPEILAFVEEHCEKSL